MNSKLQIPYRLITFDITNTLLKFKKDIGTTYGEIGIKHGVHCDPDKLTKHFKYRMKQMSIKHPNFGLNSGLLWENWWKIVVFQTFKQCQNEIDNTKLRLIYNDLMELYKTTYCWKFADGSLQLLNNLKNSGVVLGVISNFDPRLHDILHNLDLCIFFKFILTSYEVGVAKPDKEIFEKAMIESNLQNLKTDQCLHIGNTYEIDYLGAKNYGWNAYLVTNKNGRTMNFSDLNKYDVFNDMSQLQEHIELKYKVK